MIDFYNLRPSSLAEIGIRFATQEEAEAFIAVVMEELEVRIGEAVTEGRTEAEIDEMDRAEADDDAFEKWLNEHCPHFRDIVEAEQKKMERELIRNRDKIPGNIAGDEQQGSGVISRKELYEMIDTAQNGMRKICNMYARGYLSEEERRTRVQNCFEDGWRKYLEEKSLKLEIRPQDWDGFAEAVRRYRETGQPEDLPGCSWLHFFRDLPERGIRCGDEACLQDKLNVIHLLRSFRVPPEYYRPVPEGIKQPDTHISVHMPDCYYIGWDIWKDDGGLLSDSFRPGDTITLTDHYGLKTVIQVNECCAGKDDRRYNNADYAGTGTIEGYTSSRPREILIYVHKGKINGLFCKRGKDDFGSELWDEYYKDRKIIDNIYEKILDDLIETYSR